MSSSSYKYVENFLDETQLEIINGMINSYDSSDWEDAASKKWGTGKRIQKLRKTNILTNKYVGSEVSSMIGLNQKILTNEVVFGDWRIDNDSIQILKYEEGDGYDWHMDNALYDISFTLCLDDNFEGGELEFDGRWGKELITLKKGDAVFYETDKLHRVRKVSKGNRLVAIGWMLTEIKDSEGRYALHTLVDVLNKLDDMNTESNSDDVDIAKIRNQLMRVKYFVKNQLRGK